MMKEEFEQRIGLVITSEEYQDIEAAYVGLPEYVDKDKFAKIWLREKGIQHLLNKRQFRIQSLTEQLKKAEARINEADKINADWRKEFNETRNKLIALEEKLSAINAMTATY
jgi:hypothetical protein